MRSRFSVGPEVREGDTQPLEPGAGGRVLAAFSGKAGALYDEVRRTCAYLSVGERDPETSGLSAPVFDAQQALAGALGIVSTVHRAGREVLLSLRPRLLRAAARATEELGGDPAALLAAARAAAASPSTTARKRRLRAPAPMD
jgi:Bacterial transcriptional regulator